MKRADRSPVGAPEPESDGRRTPTSTERIDRAIRDSRDEPGHRENRAARQAPSWRRVLLSTARVWLDRNLPSRTARRVTAVAVAVVVVAAGGTTAVLLTRPGDPPPATASARVDADAAARVAAATWIAREVRHGTKMACDEGMCSRLRDSGVTAADLVTLNGDATGLNGAGLVIASRTVRERFGAKLAYAIAPDVLGIFGTGPARVEVRRRSTQSPEAHDRAKAHEQRSRQHAGLQLLDLPRVHTSSDAMHDLAAGEVDNRLVYTLARLARRHTINIASFGGRGPYTGIDVPERSVDIDQVDAGAAIDDNPAMAGVLKLVRAQRGTYKVNSATMDASGAAGGVLRVAFPAPVPNGVLSGGLPHPHVHHKKKAKGHKRPHASATHGGQKTATPSARTRS